MYDMHEWCAMMAHETKSAVLKTIDEILHDAGKELTGTELDKLKDAWKIISLLPKKHTHEEAEHPAEAHPAEAHPAETTANGKVETK